MNLTHLNQWLGDPEVRAICWTLVHSLWQGLLIAALAGIVILFTRKSTALLRYHLFCALLVVFVLSVSCTFIYELGWSNTDHPLDQAGAYPDANTGSSAELSVSARLSLLNTVSTFLNSQSTGIFAIWLICFLYKSIRLLGGIFYIYRIRTRRAIAVGPEMRDKVRDFAKRIGISRSVEILQSGLVKVPVTLGYLRPLIVIPAGILLQLSPEQVDTILWHELAHIRRRDYLVNILQSMVEAVFFFNPGILWLSALIREEREACCDDIVLANVEQKESYLEALMAFQGSYSSPRTLAVALSLRPSQLMDRLRRMVHKENKKLSVIEMGVLLSGLLIFSAFTFVPQAKPALKQSVAFIRKTITHTFQEQATKPFADRKPSRIIPIVTDTLANIETPLSIPADTAIVFKSIRYEKSNGDRANREMNVVDGQNNRYHILIVSGEIRTIKFNEQQVNETEFGQYKGLIAQIDAMHDSKKRLMPAQLANNTILAKKFKADKAVTPDGNSLKSKKPVRLVDSLARADRGTNPKKRLPKVNSDAVGARVRAVMADLVQARVVLTPGAVESFRLSDTALYVNDQKQPDALHRKLVENYGIKPGMGLFYNPGEKGGNGIIVDKKDLSF